MKTNRLFAGIVMTCAFLGLGANAALADDGKSFTASLCQAAGSSQDLYYSSGMVANRNASTASAECPVVRDNMSGVATWIEFEVRDRHDTQNIVCTARSLDVDGSGGGWSQTLSTSGTGFQTLSFTPTAIPDWGTYVVTCSIPGMTNNTPSYIASYRMLEP